MVFLYVRENPDWDKDNVCYISFVDDFMGLINNRHLAHEYRVGKYTKLVSFDDYDFPNYRSIIRDILHPFHIERNFYRIPVKSYIHTMFRILQKCNGDFQFMEEDIDKLFKDYYTVGEIEEIREEI